MCKNKMIFLLHIFATLTLCSSSQILIDTFYYLETVSNINPSADVFREIPFTSKARPVFQCGVECSLLYHCSGIEVCGDVLCRMWNGSFTSDTTVNATKTCRRYKKALSQNRPEDFNQTSEGYGSSSISAGNYTTPNELTNTPTPTFSTKATLQENSESFTTRVSSETTTSGDVLSSSKSFPIYSTTDSHNTTQTEKDELTSNGNVSTAADNIHSTESATAQTNTTSFVSTDSNISLLNSEVSTQLDAIDSTNSQPDSTTPIQDFTTSSESTTINTTNQDWVMTFTTSNGSSKEVPCHSDGYSWIVVQRRYDRSILFNRTWAEYENGFGNPQSDLWLGNYYISELTSAGYNVLRIDLTSYEGDKRRIDYNFHVENQTNKYRLHISERNVSGIDSFTDSNLEMFTTFDNDNDQLKAKNCAVDMISGWWYADNNGCTEANLNGVHWPQVVNDKRGVTWGKWLGTWTLKESRMMLRKP